MSVLITMKVQGDTEQFRRWVQNEDLLLEISGRAKAAGALHHRFGVGDGFVVVVDEWETAAAFDAFMAGMGDVMREAGAQGPPEVTISEAIATADQF